MKRCGILEPSVLKCNWVAVFETYIPNQSIQDTISIENNVAIKLRLNIVVKSIFRSLIRIYPDVQWLRIDTLQNDLTVPLIKFSLHFVYIYLYTMYIFRICQSQLPLPLQQPQAIQRYTASLPLSSLGECPCTVYRACVFDLGCECITNITWYNNSLHIFHFFTLHAATENFL